MFKNVNGGVDSFVIKNW